MRSFDRDNRKERCKRDIQTPARKQAWAKKLHFLKIAVFFFSIFWWGNYFNRLCQLLYNWIRMNMIFKISRSEMFYKISVLKNFAKFTWKHVRPVTLLKRDSSAGVFLRILGNLQNNSGRLLLDFFIRFTGFFLPPSEVIETRLLLFLNIFYHIFWTWWIWSFIKRQKSGKSSDNESYNEWQRMTTSSTTSDNEWYNEWQRVTMNDNEWQRVVQRVTTNDSEWQRVTTSGKTNDSSYNEWQWVVQRITTSDNEWQRITTSDNE